MTTIHVSYWGAGGRGCGESKEGFQQGTVPVLCTPNRGFQGDTVFMTTMLGDPTITITLSL